MGEFGNSVGDPQAMWRSKALLVVRWSSAIVALLFIGFLYTFKYTTFFGPLPQ